MEELIFPKAQRGKKGKQKKKKKKIKNTCGIFFFYKITDMQFV